MGLETIIGLSLAGAGTGLGIDASLAEQSAMNDAANAELKRQQGYAQQGRNAFQQSLAQSTPQAVQQQMAQGAQRAAQEYGKLQSTTAPGLGFGAGTMGQDPQLAATQNAITQSQLGQSNTAASQLQGYGASDVAQSIKDMVARQQLGQIGQFAQASENVLPLELQHAQQSRAWESGLGSLLGTGGGLLSLYGALSAPQALGPATSNQLAGLASGYGPVSAPYAGQLAASGALNPYFAQQTLAGLGYGAPLSTIGGF